MLLLAAFSHETGAQHLFGQLTDSKGAALPGAVVAWPGTTIGARTDDNGEFAIPLPPDTTVRPMRLAAIFSSVRDTFSLDDLTSYWTLQMSVAVELQEVTVRDATTGAFVSVLQPVKTEVINRAELRKAACCDLAGCFETQSTVQPTTTNILTNAKELRILGLSGVYNQVLVDGLPTIQGLTYTYGTGTIPGSMLENIWVTKGANSVLQGYESMVGQITVFPREGGIAEPFTADVLVNSFGEKHINAAVSTKKTRWRYRRGHDHGLRPNSAFPAARTDDQNGLPLRRQPKNILLASFVAQDQASQFGLPATPPISATPTPTSSTNCFGAKTKPTT
ncbi:MAG: TonB-dependent receptor plug domain-containing protein [Lewinellaceae bacterium]|nr:TonB-dependent receptor plug domain-containing protein [Lewinellaceae bacterium]